MTDTNGLILVELVFLAVFAFLGMDAIVNARSAPPPAALPALPLPYVWRWCPAGCSKMLTNDGLASCVVCQRPLEVRA